MLELRNDKPIASLAPQVAQAIQPLRGEHEAEVLDFLSAHPLLTFVMTGWIKDNGLVSELNRGTFYASRNGRGELDGVALIGHVTLVETNSEASMSRFAELTRNCPSSFVVMGEERRIDQFMKYFNPDKLRSNQGCRELLFEQRSREHCEAPVSSLRRATLDEVNLVAPVHAQMAFEESGVNPLEVDAEGFLNRCARRIQQGRVWVCIENGQLLFKADVVSDLAEVNYLEGIFVRPEDRGKGLGSACLRQLTNLLLARTKSVCLLTKEEATAAQSCYLKAGYKVREHYKTLFLEQNSNEAEN